jgi:integrase
MRHSCAIMALQAGCSVKAVQEQLGHYSSAFTMDTYAAVSNTMKKDTQCRIENLIKQVSNL